MRRKEATIMKRSYFKLNIEDVMEIVSEHMAVSEGFGCFTTNTRVIDENGEWYMVIAIGELEDREIDNLDMEMLSKKIKYNGTHGEEGYWKTNEEMRRTLSKFVEDHKK